jgi:hypothetical protein
MCALLSGKVRYAEFSSFLKNLGQQTSIGQRVTILLEDEPKIDIAPPLSDVFCAVFTSDHALSGAKDNTQLLTLKGSHFL